MSGNNSNGHHATRSDRSIYPIGRYKIGRMFSVYGLYAQNSPGVIRYIGKTRLTPEQRRNEHVNGAVRGHDQTYKANWIRSVLAQGYTVVVVLLDSAPSSREACELERRYIANTPNLTNLTTGGDGVPGRKRTDREQRMMLAVHLGAHRSQETRDRMSRARIGKFLGQPLPESTKANMKAAWTPDRRLRFGELRRNSTLPTTHRVAVTDSWVQRREKYGPSGRAAKGDAVMAAWVKRRETYGPNGRTQK